MHCIDSMFSSKKQTTRTNQYSQIPTNVEIRGPDSGKLVEISNAINGEFGNNTNLKVFSKVVTDVQYYQVSVSKGGNSKIIYRGPGEKRDFEEINDRLVIEVRN